METQKDCICFFLEIRKKDKVNVVGIITDGYRNLVEETNWKMKINIQLEGSTSQEIKSISNHLTHRYRFCIEFNHLKPGIYRAKAYDQDTGKLIAISNPLEIMDKEDKRQEIFWEKYMVILKERWDRKI